MKRGLLFVVSAPSGGGKGTILAEVRKDPKFYYSVSATTRAPRNGEVDGVHYHFMGTEQFEALLAEDAFLEHAMYCKNYYGTLRAPIEENLKKGHHVILEIEVQGAGQIRRLCPEAVFVFIAPPSMEVLEDRLRKRGTETEEVIAERVARAREELTFAGDYDYEIINDTLEKAVEDFKAVVRAEECKTIKAEN